MTAAPATRMEKKACVLIESSPALVGVRRHCHKPEGSFEIRPPFPGSGPSSRPRLNPPPSDPSTRNAPTANARAPDANTAWSAAPATAPTRCSATASGSGIATSSHLRVVHGLAAAARAPTRHRRRRRGTLLSRGRREAERPNPIARRYGRASRRSAKTAGNLDVWPGRARPGDVLPLAYRGRDEGRAMSDRLGGVPSAAPEHDDCMSGSLIGIELGVGAALLAVWLDTRIGERRPSSLKMRFAHTLSAFVIVQASSVALAALVHDNTTRDRERCSSSSWCCRRSSTRSSSDSGC